MDRKEFAFRSKTAGGRPFCGCWSTWQSGLKEGWWCGGCSGNSSLFVSQHQQTEEFINAFVAATMAAEKVPVMIVDEANIAFPDCSSNGGNGNGRREGAYRAFATFVALTQEQRKASVILVASDYAFPLGLQVLGFNKYDALNTIVAPEVEEKPMLSLLKEWGFFSRLWHRSYEQLYAVLF